MVRPAVPGDYFLIATPSRESAGRVRDLQEAIVHAVGGEVAEPVHLTLQRFEIPDADSETATLEAIRDAVRGSDPPVAIAETVFPTFHSYFARNSVRWRVEPTQDLGRLTLQSAQAIMHRGGKSHWPNAEAPIAQFITAAWTDEEVSIPHEMLSSYPTKIMDVTHLEVTRLVARHEFDTVFAFDIGRS